MGHRPRKRFGQNFLRDDAVIQGIVKAISPTDTDHIVEIGPGEGVLTAPLVASGCRLDAIELDRDLVTHLLASFSVYPGFKLHNQDALKFDFSNLCEEQERLRVVGNLPYNISTPLISTLVDQADLIEDMHFMLQKEVVERLAASPGGKNWGRLSIMAQYTCEVTHLFDVPPEAFFPPPKVDSAIVRLVPRAVEPAMQCDREKLGKVTQMAFAQRRKTLRNNFKGVFDGEQLESMGIDPAARAETLTLAQFVDITRQFEPQ